jgi:hypothetical protein
MKRTRARSLVAAAAALLAGTALVDAAPASEGPSFDQIMAAPDDVDLNIAYAEAQAAEGHLLPAAAALERVLMAHPAAHSVRLLYAVILYRLDDLQEARAQLQMVDGSKLTDLQRAELAKYQRLVSGESSDTTFGGRLSAGMAYDSDATGSLITLFDYLSIPHDSGYSMVYSGDAGFTTKVGGDLAIYGRAGGYSKTFIQGPRENFQHFDGELGVSNTGLYSSWRAGAFAHRYLLFNSPYLTEYGAHVEHSWRPNTSTIITASLELAKQDFREPLVDIFSPFIGGSHDGWRGDVQAGIAYRLDAQSTLGAVASYEYKLASYGPFSYSAPGVEANYHRFLGRGVYADLMGNVRWVDYRKIDTFFLFPATKKRADTDLFLRAALGIPLSAFSADGATGNELENIVLEGSVTYTNRNSIYPISDYDSTGAMLRIVWHFGDDD